MRTDDRAGEVERLDVRVGVDERPSEFTAVDGTLTPHTYPRETDSIAQRRFPVAVHGLRSVRGCTGPLLR